MNLRLFLSAVEPAGPKTVCRVLARLGPSWRASPWRRSAQTLSLVLFCYLFFSMLWPYPFRAGLLSAKEWLKVDLFLVLDPLVSLSTVLAARRWTVAGWGAVGILAACLFFPRGFCGYLCPLGTLIDVFDAAMARRASRLRVTRRGSWVHTRYYVLVAVLAASVGGVMVAGYVAAMPVLTRGLAFSLARLQLGLLKNWSMVPPMAWESWFSLGLFGTVLLLGVLGRRFWCRCLCPTGALFSVANALRLAERKVNSSCIGCGRCVEVCPFDAIAPDFRTRRLDCTFCQTCGGVCPTEAIQFASRVPAPKVADPPEPAGVPASRRRFIVGAGAGAIAAAGTRFAGRTDPRAQPIRPPGSVKEDRFLALCVRCGECFQVCPGPVLHPAGVEHGLESLWTPVAVMSHAGCHQDCNFCTQVCPTGAIRPLTLNEKRRTHMGLAMINTRTCLPHAGEQDCYLCYEECQAAGYDAIEMRDIRLEVGALPEGLFSPEEIEEAGKIKAPFVDPDKCVGCGLCEYRCHARWVKQEKRFSESAVVVVAENEDRAA